MDRFLARLAVTATSILIGSVAILTASVFLIVAFYLFLAELMPPWAAALATAGAAVLFAVLVFVIGSMLKPRRRSFLVPGSAAELGERLGRHAQTFARTNKFVTLGICLVAGFAIGLSPKLRAFLLRLL
jgi:hypothetical protein